MIDLSVLKGLRADLDEVMNKVNAASASNLGLSNRGYTTLVAPYVGANTGAIFVGAIKLTARASGIFLASASLAATGMTPTDTIDVEITTQTRVATSGITLTSASQTGPGTQNLASVGSAAGGYVLGAVGGLLVTGGPYGSQAQGGTGVQVLGTAETTTAWGWSNIIQNGPATVFTPFPRGNDVVLLMSVNRSAGAMTLSDVAMSLLELP